MSYEANLTPEQIAHRREYQRQWRAANPRKRSAQQKRSDAARKLRYAQDPAMRRKCVDRHIAHKLGVTTAAIAELRTGKTHCPICGCAFGPTSRKMGNGPVIDHDHVTMDIRGVICGACNLMLGAARDNIATLANGVRYLTGEIGRVHVPRTRTPYKRPPK